MRSRTRDEDGALAPALLLFLVTAVAGTFLFLQVGHGTVLARGAANAADAAALAAADTAKDHWGQWAAWHAQCEVDLVLHGPGCLAAEPTVDPGAACAAAADYAASNEATLTACSVSPPSLSDGVVAEVEVRGEEGTISGPSSTIPTRRPNAAATAQVPPPPGIGQLMSLVADHVEEIVDWLDDDGCPDPDDPPGEDEDDPEPPCEPDPQPQPSSLLSSLLDELQQDRTVRLVG